MSLIPRFDDKRTDPMSLKSVLTEIYNKTLIQAWLESESVSKNKIYVGAHDLYCSGSLQRERYGTKNADGIHMNGPSGRRDFTKSVINIFKRAQMLKFTIPSNMTSSNWSKRTNSQMDEHTDCPQAKYQRDEHTDCPQARYQRRTYSDAVKSNKYRVTKNRDHGNLRQERMEYRVPTNNRFAPLNY